MMNNSSEPGLGNIRVINGNSLLGNFQQISSSPEKVRTRGNCVNHMNSNLFTAALVVEHKARETASPEEATVSTSQDITSVKIERTKGMRKPRSASADRLLETDAPHPQVSSLSMLASPGGHSGPWTSWGHERRRQWRRSLSGSQSLSHVGYTPLNVHRAPHLRHSSGILDILPSSCSKNRSRIDEVEDRLFIGSMDAATDISNLEGHGVTHIVTVDTVPLPRKITSLLPRLACVHIQVCDIPSEDLLSHFPRALSFIKAGQEMGVVLVHCYHGKSRSAALVLAFLMAKYRLGVDEALALLKRKRSVVSPNPGFMAQLRLWEAMRCKLENDFLRYKMYKLHIVSEKIRKSKILSKEVANSVADLDPLSSDKLISRSAAVVYKCKQCRRVLATCDNLIPHQPGRSPYWHSLGARGAEGYCTQTVSINPMSWMEESLRGNLSGKLACPHCRTKVGSFSWVLGQDCKCGANIAPAFILDMTGLIFKTGGRHLHQAPDREVRQARRQPVVV